MSTLFTRVELLCGLFKNMPVRLYAQTDNGTILSSEVSNFINSGGNTVILSNYRNVAPSDLNYNRFFDSSELAAVLMNTHNGVGDDIANKIILRIQLYTVLEGHQVLVVDKELEMVEVDTIRRVIMLTDGSDVVL